MGSQASTGATQTRPGRNSREEAAPGFFAPGPRPPGSPHAEAGHSRYASAQLDPHPAAGRQARHLIRQTLTRWDMADLADDAEAIAAELAANAVLHAVPPGTSGQAIIIALHATPAGLRISVWDIGPGHPVPVPVPDVDADADAESGRGLTLVNALTNQQWGWWPTPSGGKVVYATLTAPHPPNPPEEPQMQQHPPPPPADLTAPYLLRMRLIRCYPYLTLKISSPAISQSGRWEASWNGGHATADAEPALLTRVLEELQDCGGEGHLWETTGEKRDPANSENIILTQALACDYCDEKERVITLHHPGPTVTESSQAAS